jgi:hypothetical protein
MIFEDFTDIPFFNLMPHIKCKPLNTFLYLVDFAEFVVQFTALSASQTDGWLMRDVKASRRGLSLEFSWRD